MIIGLTYLIKGINSERLIKMVIVILGRYITYLRRLSKRELTKGGV